MMPKVAFTRGLSPSINHCELVFAQRRPIDVNRAREQHRAYEALLAEQGWEVRQLPGSADFPDCVFIEDTAVVLDELAVLTRPGAESRRGELPPVAEALGPLRRIARIEPPATLDGGDVLRMDKYLYVGLSPRTNPQGVEQLRRLVEPLGYEVVAVPVHGSLHLKSAVTAIGPKELLMNVAPIGSLVAFADFTVIPVHPGEPHAANALLLDDVVLFSASAPRTCERLSRAGIRTIPIDLSELAKAEGGLTCCSLLLR